MATIEAVERRKASRFNRGEHRRQRREDRERKERDICVRLSYRADRSGRMFSLLHVDFRYWQLKSCGWDIFVKGIAVDEAGRRCDPEECAVWLWWIRLHPKQRNQVHALSIEARRGREMSDRQKWLYIREIPKRGGLDLTGKSDVNV